MYSVCKITKELNYYYLEHDSGCHDSYKGPVIEKANKNIYLVDLPTVYFIKDLAE